MEENDLYSVLLIKMITIKSDLYRVVLIKMITIKSDLYRVVLIKMITRKKRPIVFYSSSKLAELAAAAPEAKRRLNSFILPV